MSGLARLLALGFLLCQAVPPATAQEAFPNRPIKWIVSFPPGGSTDVVARAMQPSLEKRLGQPVVIENRGGAGGNLGVDAVAKSAPDGYTIGFAAAGALAVNPSLIEKMPYDVGKDLIPITLVGTSPFILIATPKFEASSLKDVIAAAKAKPGELSIGHGGNGTAMHLTAALFNQMGAVSTTLVPYRGSGPVTADVVAGHIPLGITDGPSAIGQIKGGAVKPIAVSSLQRTPSLPDIPTFDELGFKNIYAEAFAGVVVPAGTPADIVAKLQKAVATAVADPEIQKKLYDVGQEPVGGSSQQLADILASETVRWHKLIKDLNISLD